MNEKLEVNKKTKNIRTIYYFATVLSVLIFIIGIIMTGASISQIIRQDLFDILTLYVPFSMWAWLIIIGILFIKKNWIVISICAILAIPHVIAIALLLAHSHSVSYILKWYLMVLSFGILR